MKFIYLSSETNSRRANSERLISSKSISRITFHFVSVAGHLKHTKYPHYVYEERNDKQKIDAECRSTDEGMQRQVNYVQRPEYAQ